MKSVNRSLPLHTLAEATVAEPSRGAEVSQSAEAKAAGSVAFLRKAASSPEHALSANDLCVLVYRQMRGFTGPHRDLEDLAQTALEQILRADFQGRSKFSTFTHSVCYRVWLKHLRFTTRFRARFVPSDEEEALPADTKDPETLLADQRKFARLYAALDRISVKGRAVVCLHDVVGLEISEIALIVSANEATVRTRLRDGRKKLRALLDNDPSFSGFCAERPLSTAQQETACPPS